MHQYSESLLVITIILAMVVFQALVAARAHRKQTQYIPGVVDAELDHHSFVFRSHRTFLNSLENVPLFVLTAIIAIAASVDPYSLFLITLCFALARFIHMVLFYKIATNKNPSPRSYFYLIGLLNQIYLLGLIFWTLLSS